MYSNGALENNIIKLDIINTQAFVLPPRNPACKALTCSHFDGHRHVGGHGSRDFCHRRRAGHHDLLSPSASGWRYQPVEYRRVTRSSDTYSGVEMGTLGPQSAQDPPPPTVLGQHRANPPDIRRDVQGTLAGYIANGTGLKAAPPARAAAKGAAPAKGEPDMC